MSNPDDYTKFPIPQPDYAGKKSLEPTGFFLSAIAKLWRPRGAKNDEVHAATVARVAFRLTDADGNASSKEEMLGSLVGGVVHGADNSVARPTGYAFVIWIGSVEPLNAINNDIWEVTV